MAFWSKAFGSPRIIMPKEGEYGAVPHEWVKNKGGWKIHLSVKPENHEKVFNWLNKEENYPYWWKYGRNSGQEGKDFTLYIGSYDSMIWVASKLVFGINDLLMNASGDALRDDVLIFPDNHKIAARFDVKIGELHQYGFMGIPFFNSDMDIWNRPKDPKDKLKFYTDAVERAHNFLVKAFGAYYVGSSKDFMKRFVLPFANRETSNPSVSRYLDLAKE